MASIEAEEAQRELLANINENGNKIKVRDQLITIEKPTKITDSVNHQVRQRYQSTLIKEAGGYEAMADTAYALSEQGSVVCVIELPDFNMSYANNPFFQQSLLEHVLLGQERGEESETNHIFGLPIFLNKEGKYIPPRKVDVIVTYWENYNSAPDDTFKRNLIENIVGACGDYDFVLNDDTFGIGFEVADYIDKHPGTVRCVFRP